MNEAFEKLTEKQKEILIHEAGHAYMCFVGNIAEVEVDLNPKGEGLLASTNYRSLNLENKDKRLAIDIGIAGPLTESIYRNAKLTISNFTDFKGKEDLSHINRIIENDLVDVNIVNRIQILKEKIDMDSIKKIAENIAMALNDGKSKIYYSELFNGLH